jgi:hypothetical protein
MFKLRSIVRNSQFGKELDEIEPHVERADELLEGVENVLARLPQCGQRLGESDVWFIAGWTVDLAIYYTFNDESVFLLSICRTKPIMP